MYNVAINFLLLALTILLLYNMELHIEDVPLNFDNNMVHVLNLNH